MIWPFWENNSKFLNYTVFDAWKVLTSSCKKNEHTFEDSRSFEINCLCGFIFVGIIIGRAHVILDNFEILTDTEKCIKFFLPLTSSFNLTIVPSPPCPVPHIYRILVYFSLSNSDVANSEALLFLPLIIVSNHKHIYLFL